MHARARVSFYALARVYVGPARLCMVITFEYTVVYISGRYGVYKYLKHTAVRMHRDGAATRAPKDYARAHAANLWLACKVHEWYMLSCSRQRCVVIFWCFILRFDGV